MADVTYKQIVKQEDVQVGDLIHRFRWTNGFGARQGKPGPWNNYGPGTEPKVTKVDGQAVHTAYGHFHVFSDGDVEFEVLRKGPLVTQHPLAQGKFSVSAAPVPRKVKDWPLDCPLCRRPESAYLGLNQYDCKHGCYK